MKIKTSELSGVALDWAVAMAVGVEIYKRTGGMISDGETVLMTGDHISVFSPSTDWSQGGQLIERFDITIIRLADHSLCGRIYQVMQSFSGLHLGGERMMPFGPSRLIAACRAIVAAKLGDEVDVPEGLA